MGHDTQLKVAVSRLDVNALLEALHSFRGGWSPWAIILVCFNDDPQELPPLDHYKKLFTQDGSGT